MKHIMHGAKLRTASGQSLVEVIVAIGLLAIIASSFFIFIWNQLSISSMAGQSIEAVSIAQEGVDAVRAIRDNGWSDIPPGTYGITYTDNGWALQGTPDTTDGYTRTVIVNDVSPTERQIVVDVTWVDDTGKIQTTTLATTVSDWQEVSAAPTTQLSGDWSKPQTLSELDIGLNTVGTGVAVRNKLVYMTGTGSSDQKDFYVINATDSAHPTKAASIDTGPGLNALAINGNYAYVANNYSSKQLQIINISATTSPYMIGTGLTLTGNTHAALSVAATGTLVLVGTALDNGPELYLVDVSNPAIPVIKSNVKIKGNVDRIAIRGDRAFLATSSSTAEFVVVNIANPNVPVITAKADLPGTNAAKGITVNPKDHHATVVRAKASGTSPEINVFDVSNPDAPILLASKELNGNVFAASAVDDLLFLGTDVTNQGIQIFDVSNLPTFTLFGSLNPLIVNDIAYENNIFYGSLQGVTEELVIFTSK